MSEFTTPSILRPIPDILEHLNFLLRQGAGHDLALDLGADILDLIAAKLTEYAALPDEPALVTSTLWTGHTWFTDILSTTPRLTLVSPEPGSGKSNLLKVMRVLVPLGVRTENATPAWVYHEMESRRDEDAVRPTIMLDEFDCLSPAGKDNVEMRRIIDAGAYVGGTVNRHIGKKNVDWDVFGPMAIAGNMLAGQIHRAILSRSIVIQMQKARRGVVPKRWYERTSPAEVEPLREPIRRWAALVHPTAKEHKPLLPEEVWNRNFDLWEPLVLVADMAGGRWPDLARVAAVTAVTAADNDPSPGLQLLEATRVIFNGENTNPSPTLFPAPQIDKIFTRDLLAKLGRTGLFRWANREYQAAALELRKQLGAYGIAPKDIRIDGENGSEHFKGYTREAFEPVWEVYLPTAVTPVTPVTNDGESG